MNTQIVKTLALAFSLGIAPGAVFAQTDAGADVKKPQVEGEAGAAAEGGAAGTQVQGQNDAQGEAGVTAGTDEQQPAGEAAAADDTAASDATQPQDGEAEAAAEDSADTGTDAASDATQPQDGEAEAAAEGEPGVSDETTAAVDVTVEQQTEIREVVREVEVDPVDVDFDIAVGVAVPTTVELHPLPPRIVEIVPAYEDYLFFILADGRIVIVDPDDHDIVIIIA